MYLFHIDIMSFYRLLQKLYNLGNVDIHASNESAVIYSCNKNHIEIAKWFWLGNVDIHAFNESAFGYSCANGHF